LPAIPHDDVHPGDNDGIDQDHINDVHDIDALHKSGKEDEQKAYDDV
jgi:hypothetical protein